MTTPVNCTQPRDLRSGDLETVAKIHKECFPVTISIFSALDSEILKLYYQMFIEESESYVAVLEDTVSNRVIGFTFGTRKLGIQERFLKKYRCKILFAIMKGLLTRVAVWKAMLARLTKQNALSMGTGPFCSELAKLGLSVPAGLEDINLGIAIDPNFRGHGNAARLIDFYQKKVFQLGAVRVRGAILTSNLASMTFFQRQGWQFLKASEKEVVVWIDRPAFISVG